MIDKYSFNIGNADTFPSPADEIPNIEQLIGCMVMPHDGVKVSLMGWLLVDAYLKASMAYGRQEHNTGSERRKPYGAGGGPYLSWLVRDVIGSIKSEQRRRELQSGFMLGLGNFVLFTHTYPEEMPEVIKRIRYLTNERLSERCRAIFEQRHDPGSCEVWSFPAPDFEL